MDVWRSHLVRLDRFGDMQTWLVRGPQANPVPTSQALAQVRRVYLDGSSTARELQRVVADLQPAYNDAMRDPDSIWQWLSHAIQSGRLAVVVEGRPGIQTRPRRTVEPEPEPAAPPEPRTPILGDDRALQILRSDPELEDGELLHFEYMIRGLAGRSVHLRIRSASFPGAIVHERALTPSETENHVHAATWDGIVTAPGPFQQQRLSPTHGPCVVQIVHDDTYRDEAPFSISRSVMVIALDGFFHTGSALFLPSRPAQGGPVQTRTFPAELRDELRDGSWFESIPFLDEPFAPPEPGERRDTVGLLLLANILDECGGTQATRRLLLCGHADSAGSDSYNDELSAARAQCVWSILCGDGEGYGAATDEFHVIEDNYVLLRYCAQRYLWSCDPGDPRGSITNGYREAVRCFQREYNQRFTAELEVDGKVGAQTRKAFLAIYESVLSDAFGGEAELTAYRDRLQSNVHGPRELLGCGERYGAAQQPKVRGRDDRRVEALLFLPDDPVPDSPADIYEQANYRFTRWTAVSLSEPPCDGSEARVDEQGEYREPASPSPLPSYEPSDPDDPWDFLNAFRGAVNQGLQFLSGE